MNPYDEPFPNPRVKHFVLSNELEIVHEALAELDSYRPRRMATRRFGERKNRLNTPEGK